jgi:hypothetical protein
MTLHQTGDVHFPPCRFPAGSRRLPTERWDGNVISGTVAIGKAPSINTFFTEVAEKIENKTSTDYNKTYDTTQCSASPSGPTDTLARTGDGNLRHIIRDMMDFDKEAEKSRSYAQWPTSTTASCGPSK